MSESVRERERERRKNITKVTGHGTVVCVYINVCARERESENKR